MSMFFVITVVILVLMVLLIAGIVIYLGSRKLGSALPDDQKPEWIRAAMEQANTPTTTADGSPEHMASPIAEAIEGLLQKALETHPELSNYHIDLGSAPDGSLEIWVNGEKFEGVESLKDEKLKRVFREVVDNFNK